MLVGRGSKGATGRAEEHAGSNLSVAVKHSSRVGGRVEAAACITSKANLWADLGSRGRQAAAAGLAPRRVGVSAEW
eukprot:1945663-Prymnesium_polylepis.1